MVLKTDLKKYDLKELGKFDVILIDPPWEEYKDRLDPYMGNVQSEKLESWTFEEILNLKIESLAETPSFLFLWVGSENLEKGRECFRKWGFKRCEDVVWIKMNKEREMHTYVNTALNHTFLQRVKEHCLVGYNGDVRKASDPNFIHPNIDTDVIVEEEPENGDPKKPDEIYDIIERFCLGRKRLELFGDFSSIRPGWLTVGKYLPESDYDQHTYNSWFSNNSQNNMNDQFDEGRYLGTTDDIENLRPKSPPKGMPTYMQEYEQILSQMMGNQAYVQLQQQQQQPISDMNGFIN